MLSCSSGTRDSRLPVETEQRAGSQTRSRTSTSGAGSSPVLVDYPDKYRSVTVEQNQRRRISDTEADWEDLVSELNPSDSASYTKDPARNEDHNRRKHRSSQQTQHQFRRNGSRMVPAAPEPAPAVQQYQRREVASDYRDYDHRDRARCNSSRDSYPRDIDYYRDYYEDSKRGRRNPRREYVDDYYSNDHRRDDYSPPHSPATTYGGFGPASGSRVVHYQTRYPLCEHPRYLHPGYPISPPPSSAGDGYFPSDLIHHYPSHYLSQVSTTAHTAETTAALVRIQESITERQDEALRKQEECFAHLRAQLDTESATRLARDKAREGEIKRQKTEYEAKIAADAEALHRADEVVAAAEAARLEAEAVAAAKAKEAEDKAANERAKLEQDLLELKKKNDDAKAAEEALKAERDALKPTPDDTKAPLRFKDAGGRTWTFPWKYCKEWKTMQVLIVKCYQDHPGVYRQVEQGRYWLFGPDEVVIMPELWEDTVQPGWEVAMQLWPLPPPGEGRRRREAPDAKAASPSPPPAVDRKSAREKGKKKSSSTRPKSPQTVVVELPERTRRTSSRRQPRQRQSEESFSPPPPPSSPPAATPAASESADDDEVIEVVTKVESIPSTRRRKSSKPENLPLVTRWMMGALARERRR